LPLEVWDNAIDQSQSCSLVEWHGRYALIGQVGSDRGSRRRLLRCGRCAHLRAGSRSILASVELPLKGRRQSDRGKVQARGGTCEPDHIRSDVRPKHLRRTDGNIEDGGDIHAFIQML
jgi:hypothetical protein